MKFRTIPASLMLIAGLTIGSTNSAQAQVGSHGGVGSGSHGVGAGGSSFGSGSSGVGSAGSSIGSGNNGVGYGGRGSFENNGMSTGVGFGSNTGFANTETGLGRGDARFANVDTGVGDLATPFGDSTIGVGRGVSAIAGNRASARASLGRAGNGYGYADSRPTKKGTAFGTLTPHLGGYKFGGNSGITSDYVPQAK